MARRFPKAIEFVRNGFARTAEHRVDRLGLRCRTHNQLAADPMYGRDFMDSKRRSIRPGGG